VLSVDGFLDRIAPCIGYGKEPEAQLCSDPALCLRIFKSNRDAGLLLFAGLLVDAVMR
jgi:hypothetical protein